MRLRIRPKRLRVKGYRPGCLCELARGSYPPSWPYCPKWSRASGGRTSVPEKKQRHDDLDECIIAEPLAPDRGARLAAPRSPVGTFEPGEVPTVNAHGDRLDERGQGRG
jgi:hypothetical protein